MRPDVDLSAANDCMKKGLEILDKSTTVFPNNSQMLDRDSLNQIRDVMNEFFANPAITPEAAQARSSKSSRTHLRSKTFAISNESDVKIDPAEMPDRFELTKPCPERSNA